MEIYFHRCVCVVGCRDSPVVVLDHRAHGPDGRQVLVVALGVDEVEGLGGPGVPVGTCEVYGYLKQNKDEYEGSYGNG